MQPEHRRREKSEVGNENRDDYLLSDFVALLCTVPMDVLQQKCLETKCLVNKKGQKNHFVQEIQFSQTWL